MRCGLPPMGQIVEHVGPQQEKQFARRILVAKMGQSIDAIINAAAVRFITADGKCRMPANRQFQHLNSILRRSQFPLLLMGRNGGRHKPYGVQLALFAAAFRQQQMAEMDRIETAAEDSDTHALKDLSESGIVGVQNLNDE